MKILIVNDDGIDCEGIRVSAEYAKTLGEVTLIAPKYQQSGKSHSIDIHNAFEIKKVDAIEGAECYTVDSSPADCVRFGIIGLERKYDLVISGVNNGYNIGEDILYSGTVAAIFEAALNGHNGIALSTDFFVFDSARRELPRIFDFVYRNKLFEKNRIYNVNIPLSVKGLRVTKQGGAYYKDHFVEKEKNMFYQQGYSVYEGTKDLTIDTDCVMNGYISLTPMSVARTDFAAYSELSKLSQLNDEN